MKRQALILVVALVAAVTLWPGLTQAQPLPAENIVGLWRSQFPTPMGMGFSEVVFMPDGRFQKKVRAGELMTLDIGRYTVGQGYIHFDIEDHEPKTYMGQPMQWVKSETWLFRFVNPDLIIFEDRLTGTRWEAHRVR